MLKQTMTLAACVFTMMLVMGCDGMVTDESVNSTTQELVDPHCTNGECTPYVEDCWNRGRDVVCLNGSSDNPVTLCLPVKATNKLYEHHPDACRGSCSYPTVCNN